MTTKRDWYAGLREEMETEVRLCVRNARRNGKTGWGTGLKAQKGYIGKTIVKPLFPMLAKEDETDGRTLACHAEIAEEMITRHELGMSLWSDDVADTDEDCVGVELNRSEAELMGRLFKVADETKLKDLRK